MKDLLYFTTRLQCSREEKIECLQTMKKMSNVLVISRQKSFLAVEELLEGETDPLIKACINDVLDCSDSDLLEKRFEEYLVAGNYYGKDFLQAIIVIKGFLNMHTCPKLNELWNEMQGYFGADFSEEYREAFLLEQKKMKATCN